MNPNYNNPIVTYDEIVEALISIIECSINNDYENDFNYLNVKYESGIESDIETTKEALLYKALKDLEKSLDASSKMIRLALDENLNQINNNIFTIQSEYLLGQEERKLSAQNQSIKKLKEASLDISELYNVPDYRMEETALEKLSEIDTNKVFSEFEKRVIDDFPEFFKREKNDEDIDLFDELEKREELRSKYPDDTYEEVVIDQEKRYDLEKISMIEKALKKARKIGNVELVSKLEKMYEFETK